MFAYAAAAAASDAAFAAAGSASLRFMKISCYWLNFRLHTPVATTTPDCVGDCAAFVMQLSKRHWSMGPRFDVTRIARVGSNSDKSSPLG